VLQGTNMSIYGRPITNGRSITLVVALFDRSAKVTLVRAATRPHARPECSSNSSHASSLSITCFHALIVSPMRPHSDNYPNPAVLAKRVLYVCSTNPINLVRQLDPWPIFNSDCRVKPGSSKTKRQCQTSLILLNLLLTE
jgi:hypothetical protein